MKKRTILTENYLVLESQLADSIYIAEDTLNESIDEVVNEISEYFEILWPLIFMPK